MTWFMRFSIGFFVAAVMFLRLYIAAQHGMSAGLLLLLFAGAFAAVSVVVCLLSVKRPALFSPLASGILAGLLAACAALLLMPAEDEVSEARMLTLGLVLCHFIPLASVWFASSRSLPGLHLLTASAGIGLVLAIVCSMAFFWHRCGPSLRVGLPFEVALFAFPYWAVALLFLLLIPHRTVVLLDALSIHEPRKREKALPRARMWFLAFASVPLIGWTLIAIAIWFVLGHCPSPFSQESVGGF
ncbi:MAG: hypothetical protein WC712_06600 [Candidatus Brocadiia bacterium]